MRNCWRWWRTVWKGVNRDTEQWWRGVLWEWANCVGTYLKGRTGDILWREEPCKAISSNAIKGQDYLGNGIRNTKFCYRCRTEAPRTATGETGIWLWPLDRPHVWGQLLFCLRVCVCVCHSKLLFSSAGQESAVGVHGGATSGTACFVVAGCASQRVACVHMHLCVQMYVHLWNACRPCHRLGQQMGTAANRLRGEITWAGKSTRLGLP